MKLAVLGFEAGCFVQQEPVAPEGNAVSHEPRGSLADFEPGWNRPMLSTKKDSTSESQRKIVEVGGGKGYLDKLLFPETALEFRARCWPRVNHVTPCTGTAGLAGQYR